MSPDALQAINMGDITPSEACKQLIKVKALIKDLKEREEMLSAQLLEVMQRNDVLSLKTGEYSISRSTRITPKVYDINTAKAALATITEVRTKEVLDESMFPLIKQLIASGSVIDGIDAQVTEYTQVRVAKGK